MDSLRLLNAEVRGIGSMPLMFEETGETDPSRDARVGEAMLKVKLQIVGSPHSISRLHSELTTGPGADIVERLASALGNSSSAPSGVHVVLRPQLPGGRTSDPDVAVMHAVIEPGGSRSLPMEFLAQPMGGEPERITGLVEVEIRAEGR